MNILELAAELGKLIKDDARIKRMEAAREAYENDSSIQNALFEYNAQQTALAEEYKKDDPDTDLIKSIEARINQLYVKITEDAKFDEYNRAQEEVNILMSEVNDEISFQITGERPSQCAHDCSSCGGSCGHSH